MPAIAVTKPVNPLLCSVLDAARMLGISDKTVRNQISLDTFPLPVIRLGGRTLLRVSDIEKFVETGKPVKLSLNRDPHTVDLVSGLTDAENKPRRGRPRKIQLAGAGGAA